VEHSRYVIVFVDTCSPVVKVELGKPVTEQCGKNLLIYVPLVMLRSSAPFSSLSHEACCTFINDGID